MRRGRVGLSMADRVRLGREAGGDDPGGDPGRAPGDGCPGRHCWVADAADHAGVKRPGLLLEWRQRPDGAWEGRVVYVLRLRASGWATAEEWLPADRLAPG